MQIKNLGQKIKSLKIKIKKWLLISQIRKGEDLERGRLTNRMMSVPSEPDSGEMAPTEFGLNDIATCVEGVADSDGVVATASVIFGSFVFGGEIAAFGVVVFAVVTHFRGNN